MIIINNVFLPLDTDFSLLKEISAKKLKIAKENILSVRLHKKSVDARDKTDVKFCVSIVADVKGDVNKLLKKNKNASLYNEKNYALPSCSNNENKRPVIVGFGPAGMFCALFLARAGLKPVVIERGADIDTRIADVDAFYKTKKLNTDSNIQFGAGGAGTFSDGKLLTRVNDPLCGFILKKLHEFGAPKEILHLAKPHIGTDVLRKVVQNAEDAIIRLGGEVHYRTQMTGICKRDGKVIAVETNKGQIPCGALILAPGHSARDTYRYLYENNYDLMAKDFSVGVRIEHLQSGIDDALYGPNADIGRLGHGEYQLSYREGERGVYSFCMCPGGVVAAAASEEGGVVVNGMSYHARDGKNANCALAVSVLRSDYGNDPMAAIEFQRAIEKKAYLAAGGNYSAPMQTVGDFLDGKVGTKYSAVVPTYMDGYVTPCDLNKILPDFVTRLLKTGIARFERNIKGFSASEAVLTAPETRTSAPLRIMRNESGVAIGNINLYPCGEGAGYAGGITSAAVDGMRAAMHLMETYNPIIK